MQYITKIFNEIKSKITIEGIVRLLISLLFCYVIICGRNYELAEYQSIKDQALSKEFLALIIVVFILCKVNIINLQSLAVTLIYLPVAYLYARRFVLSPDLFPSILVNALTQWFVLMTVTDIFVHERYKNFPKYKPVRLFLFLVLSLLMIVHGVTGKDGFYTLVPIGMFLLISMSQEQYEELIRCFCNSFFLAFIYFTADSLIRFPYSENTYRGRYSGCFSMPASAGVVITCCILICIYGMMTHYKKGDFKNPIFIISAVWLSLCIIFSFFIQDRAMFVGFAVLIIVFLLQIRKKLSHRFNIIFLSVIIGLAIAGTVTLVLLSKHAEELYYYWTVQSYEGAGIKRIISNSMCHLFEGLGAKPIADNVMPTPFTGIWGRIDLMSSGRLNIWRSFIQNTAFEPQGTYGIPVDDYFAFDAHNKYIQTLYQYGWVTGGLYILFRFLVLADRLKAYRNNHRNYDLLISMWLIVFLSIWCFESAEFILPAPASIMFLTVLLYPFIVDIECEDKSGILKK